MPSTSRQLSIYLHIPFCTAKCTYCAFNTYINLEHLIDRFVDALIREIEAVGHTNPYPEVGTIFLGGGTPSLLSIAQFERILTALNASFNIIKSAEITTEANPNDLDTDYLVGLRQAGINRISIGMQSSNTSELKFFARRHDHPVLIESFKAARAAGFDNINLDLIYGFPYQTLESWKGSLEDALTLRPEHFSLYALGVEPETPLHDWINGGDVPAPDDDLAADMYELASEMLANAGYKQYEISNWSLPGLECKHNLQYWRNDPYVGLGPGAHGFADGVRYSTLLSPQEYIRQLLKDDVSQCEFPLTAVTHDFTSLTEQDEIAETLMMNLRLMEGVHRQNFKDRFEIDLMDLHGQTLARFEQLGIVEISHDVVRISEKGRLLSNMLFRELV